MKLNKFNYQEPQELENALSLLDRYGDTAAILAGGTDLMPLMKKRSVKPEYIINIKGVRELNFIKTDGVIEIGPLMTIRALENSAILQRKCPMLTEIAAQMAYVQVRNLGTIGGNICNASPAADFGPALMVLDTVVEIMSVKGKKSVSITDFFLGPGKTVIDKNEVVTGFSFRGFDDSSTYAFEKVPSRTSKGLAVASVAVLSSTNECTGTVIEARIAVGSMGPTPMRCFKTEKLLIGEKINKKMVNIVSEAIAEETEPISDVRGTKGYRIHLIKAITRQALMDTYRRYLG